MPPADTYWVESNGAIETKTPNVPSVLQSLDRADFISQDISSHSNPTNYLVNPIIVPNSGVSYSFEKWIRMYFKFMGSTLIDNVKFWKSSGILSDPNIEIKWPGSALVAYAQPVNTNPRCTVAIPVAEPGSQNITLNGGNISINADGFTDYIVLQLVVPSTVVNPGNISSTPVEYTLQYDEM